MRCVAISCKLLSGGGACARAARAVPSGRVEATFRPADAADLPALTALLADARTVGVRRVSLSVDRDDPAYRLYWEAGFRVAAAAGGAWTMVADLAPAAPDGDLLAAVRAGLAEAADPARAPGMRAYLKSALPCHGVYTSELRRVCREAFGAHPLTDQHAWRATVLALWREAGYREERHATIALSGWPAYASWQGPDLVPVYDELVVTGAWWDLVDDVAIRRIGPLLRAHPEAMGPLIQAYATDADRWRRRTAVICQIGAKARTDLALLTEAIEANAGETDFFLRKGIGWALREQAKTDPDWVRRFVAERAGTLSPLSRREALKNVGG
jgi:3-methyladenine DNA glycosylase AlkD